MARTEKYTSHTGTAVNCDPVLAEEYIRSKISHSESVVPLASCSAFEKPVGCWNGLEYSARTGANPSWVELYEAKLYETNLNGAYGRRDEPISDPVHSMILRFKGASRSTFWTM